MPVQLLPLQKLVDMPNLAQHHRRTICGLAIASIVLIFTILCILVPAFIAGFAMSVYSTNTLFAFVGIPLMVIILILVCTSSFISFRNTDRWESTDTCCNLMRSNPACCTKCCAGNKHCCARMSCLHIAASGLTSSFCVLLVVLLFAGCNESDSITRAYESKYPSRRPGRSLTTVVAARFAPKSNAELKAAIAQCLKLSSDCSKGPRGPIWSWDVSGVTDMRYLFVDKHYNAVPGADKFNGDISNWDVSSVTRMGGMFYKAQSFNGDLSKWDVSKVTDMEAMFEDAASFNGDISKWDVSKVNDVKSMFHGAKSFSQKLCGSWANLSAGRKRNMFDKSDLSLFCKTTSKTTNAENKCLDVFFAIENYRSCCTNFGYMKKGRESVCRMASPCVKGGMQDPRCQFATRTTAFAPTTAKYRTRLDRTTPPRDKVPDKYRDYHYGSGHRYRSTPETARDYSSYWEQHKYESSKHRSTPEPARDYSSYWEQHKYESSKHACSVLAGFEVPAIALMICLAITTAVSAHLLRKIEQAQPEIELLPAGKMVVVQACEDTVSALIKANIIDDDQVTNV